jgi:thioredoxin-related protein
MSRFAKALALGVLLFAVSAGLYAESISWKTDLAAALKEAKDADKAVLIDVYTEWCGWCKKLDEEVYTDPGVIAEVGNFVALKVDAEKEGPEAEFVQLFNVGGYPTILFVEPDGSLIGRIGGYMDAVPFSEMTAVIGSNRSAIRSGRAEFAAGDYSHSVDLIAILAGAGCGDEAASIFKKLDESSAFTAPRRESSAFAVGSAFQEAQDYERALEYYGIVEAMALNSENMYQARYYSAMVILYSSGRLDALKYLDSIIADKKTPAEWKKQYAGLRAQIDEMR